MLGIIVSTLFISLIANIFLKKIGLPTIIGYIVTGTMVAYSFGLHDAVNNETLKEIAELGIAFLMFTIGLEFSIKHLNDIRNKVFIFGSAQIILTFIPVFLISFYLFGIDKNSSLIIAMAISMSSTAIVLKTFNETGEINKKYGQNVIGILIMQDIAVIPILILIGVLGTDTNTVSIILETIIDVIILLACIFVTGKYLLELFLRKS